ncbi:unnamed protein product, partial [Discosporangium mesarthrocarpum]
MASYAHEGVTERYELTNGGFEQSFVIAERPAGHGDLVLGIAVHSATLRAPIANAAHQALSFTDQDGNSIRYGEAVVFARGSAPMPIDTRYDGMGRIELVVPGDFLDGADYPIVVDPIVGSQMAPQSGFSDSEPDIAYDPVEERTCIVWRRQFTINDYRIRAVIHDVNGNQVGPLIAVTNSGFTYTPTVSFAN